MNKTTTVTNENQKYILSQLKTRQFARFKDIMPPKISSNAFSYHLKELQKGGWIVKADRGYTLGPAGLALAERKNDTKAVRMQPNTVLALVIQDGYGKILVHKKQEQPYIGHWELPSVAASVADTSIRDAGIWAAKQHLHFVPQAIKHAGICYVRVHKGKVALSSTMFHIVRITVDELKPRDGYEWVEPLALDTLPHVPGLTQVVARTFFNDDFFFEEFTQQFSDQQSLAI